MPNPIDLTGQQFGKLTVINLHSTGGRGLHGRKWLCACECGHSTVAESGNLRSGNSKACGHCRAPAGNSLPRHGHKRGDYVSPTYETWRAMKRRVANPTDNNAPYYEGVDIDPRWLEFEAFLADMGERPEGLTIDRKENDRGYWPDNCRWATPTQQTRNRRIALIFEFEGRKLPIAEWAKEFGISYGAAHARIRRFNSLRLPD